MTTTPDCCTDAMLQYLDKLRESGDTNMLGAVPYLRDTFTELSYKDAKAVLLYWMETFGEEPEPAAEEPTTYEPSDAAMAKAQQVMEDLLNELAANQIKLMRGQIPFITPVDDSPVFNAVLYYMAYALEVSQ